MTKIIRFNKNTANTGTFTLYAGKYYTGTVSCVGNVVSVRYYDPADDKIPSDVKEANLPHVIDRVLREGMGEVS